MGEGRGGEGFCRLPVIPGVSDPVRVKFLLAKSNLPQVNVQGFWRHELSKKAMEITFTNLALVWHSGKKGSCWQL